MIDDNADNNVAARTSTGGSMKILKGFLIVMGTLAVLAIIAYNIWLCAGVADP